MVVYLLLISVWVSADWTLGTVLYKDTDIVLDSAWNYKASGKVRYFSSLNNMLQKSHQLKHLVVDRSIDSRGLALSGHNAAGDRINLFFDGQPSHSIEWERKKTKTITHFPQWCQISDGSYCARVIMRDGATGGLMAEPAGNVHDDNRQVFNLLVSGTGGQYKLSLVPA